MALFDNCNSLHTNAYDEAVTTPTEESVRRAMAIQMIITREFGLANNENPLQGSLPYRGADRPGGGGRAGGVRADRPARRRAGRHGDAVPARRKSRTSRCSTSTRNTAASCPSWGSTCSSAPAPTRRATRYPANWPAPPKRRRNSRSATSARSRSGTGTRPPRRSGGCKKRPSRGGNIFAELMETVKVASLGQISHALYEVGGKYRRNM